MLRGRGRGGGGGGKGRLLMQGLEDLVRAIYDGFLREFPRTILGSWYILEWISSLSGHSTHSETGLILQCNSKNETKIRIMKPGQI